MCIVQCAKGKEGGFWEDLGSIRGLWSDLWCVGGDFNMIRFPGERSRGGGLSATMRRFSKVLHDFQEGPFTWRGGLNNQFQSRLDQCLVTNN